jgi:hypothetical protein
MPYRIVFDDENKQRWYWTGHNWWTSFRPNARLYRTRAIAQSALSRMIPDNQANAYIQKTNPTLPERN